MSTPELDFDADTFQGALDYFAQRDLQLRETGWRLRYTEFLADWGVLTRFENGDEKRFAVYVLASHRGEGRLSEFVRSNPGLNYITVDDCNVEGFYRKHGCDILVLPSS